MIQQTAGVINCTLFKGELLQFTQVNRVEIKNIADNFEKFIFQSYIQDISNVPYDKGTKKIHVSKFYYKLIYAYVKLKQ